MSGVEIAGFVLGGLPLIISVCEHYKAGFEPLVKWKRFRTEFIGFIDAVDIEKQLSDQMLERFLISAEVLHEELQLFMTDLGYGVAYGGPECAGAEEGWEYQMKKIRLSFSKKGPKTVASLETHNRKLRELLDSNNKLDSTKAPQKDNTWGTIFESTRRHAGSVYTVIKKSWNCSCTKPHLAGLRLQKRLSGYDPEFSMAFNIPNESHEPLTHAREVVISMKREMPNGSGPPQIIPSQSPEELPAPLRELY